MEKVNLEATVRESRTKADRNSLRKSGRIPGVFYSKYNDTIAFEASDKEVNPLIFTSKTHLISLNIKGHEEYECVIKDVQFDPITDKVLHFDLLGLRRGEKIELDVPVQLIGSAVGIKEGGVVQHTLHKLNINCLPKDIPESLEVDISELKLGDAISVGDLKFDDIEILNSEESVVVQVTHPRKEVEPVVEETLEGEESAEPEVIGKGKDDDEGSGDEEEKEDSK